MREAVMRNTTPLFGGVRLDNPAKLGCPAGRALQPPQGPIRLQEIGSFDGGEKARLGCSLVWLPDVSSSDETPPSSAFHVADAPTTRSSGMEETDPRSFARQAARGFLFPVLHPPRRGRGGGRGADTRSAPRFGLIVGSSACCNVERVTAMLFEVRSVGSSARRVG